MNAPLEIQNQKSKIENAPDWNFDSIPDRHLIACCYWEYARESTFLREFKSRCVEANRHLKPLAEAFDLCGKDARRVLSIGPVANSFLVGFGFAPPNGHPGPQVPLAPPVSGLFPAPWQSLPPAERDYRARLAAGSMPPDPEPFQRAAGPAARDALVFLADSLASSQSSPSPRTSFSPVPSLLRLDTHSRPADELALVQIDWGHFTDDQIVESFRSWLKANRPATVRPQPARGHKLKDWRANLTRLAVMRLLSRSSALDLIDPNINKLPDVWQTTQFSGPTWLNVTKWYDARREARHLFHQLFPFLPPTENPISWPTSRT